VGNASRDRDGCDAGVLMSPTRNDALVMWEFG
jgi:hypothetical protein